MKRYACGISLVVAACGASPNKPVEPAHEVHVAIAKIAPRLDDQKLWLAFDATPKRVMTGEAVLVRAACTKNGGAPMTGTAAWPLPENAIETKQIDIPIENIVNATACQFEFHLVADLLAQSGEHIATSCWTAGKVTAGACTPAITESFAQGVAALCKASSGVRWDATGLDRDPALVKSVDERVWNQQAKELFHKLLASPEANRVAPLKAEATKQGVVDCELATFWATPKS